MNLRVFNYNTLEKVHNFEAHTDYIRCLAVHPTQPLVLSCSDDMMIKMWDWDKKWQCVQVGQGEVEGETRVSNGLNCSVLAPLTSRPLPHSHSRSRAADI